MNIEENIPRPVVGKRGRWEFINSMDIGQSFLLETEEEFQRGRDAMRFYCKKNGWSYTTHKQLDGTGWRVWRTE